MSRVGKYPVEITGRCAGRNRRAHADGEGKLGEMSLELSDAIIAKVEDGKFSVAPNGGERAARMMLGHPRGRWWPTWSRGVSAGYTKTMEIQGTGFRAAVNGPNLVINLGLLA